MVSQRGLPISGPSPWGGHADTFVLCPGSEEQEQAWAWTLTLFHGSQMPP